MKMYLSSYKLGNHTDELLRLLGGKTKVGVIMAAQDYKDAETRTERLQEEFAVLTGLGLEPQEVDLRDHFEDNNELASYLASFDLIWVRGGNAFVLRKALAQSGADEILSDLIRSNKIVYGGYSAGICILAPSLHGLELVDVEDLYVPKYQTDIIWDGLNLLPYSLAPHYKSNHYESDAIEDVVKYYKSHDIPFKTLHDGNVLIIDGEIEKVLV